MAALRIDEEKETEGEEIRTATGAMLLAEAIHELKNIRRLLTPKKSDR
jgi:hypothetical protein